MSAIIIPDSEAPLPLNPRKTGEFYDTCPYDGCGEWDVSHRNEGDGGFGKRTEGGRETAHEWSIYSADRRSGGCGGLWSRANSTGARRDQALGRASKGLTSDAATSRTYFLPTEAYSANYERAFGHA